LKSLATLGELIPDEKIRCGVPGCENLCAAEESGTEGSASSDDGDAVQMCPDCRETYAQLEHQEQPCARPGCNNTWIWTRYDRLKARVNGREEPPKGLCEDCLEKLDDVEDKQVPCRIRGCTNTWKWPRKQQLMQTDDQPPRRLCRECRDTLKRLETRKVACRIKGCEGTWAWGAFHQLEHCRSGRTLDEPPRRMCEDCYGLYRQLQDKEVPCKIRECSNTWTYTAFAQVQDQRRYNEIPEEPKRMCADCVSFCRQTEPREAECATPGCRNTWTYTKGMQLRDWHKGIRRLPRGHCDQCKNELKQLQDRPENCLIPGCNGTWTYTAREQLKDIRRHRERPPEKRCEACETFLAQHQTATLECTCCGKKFQCSGYQQLVYERKGAGKPEVCPDCHEKNLHTGTQGRAKAGHQQVISIPSKGPWQSDREIANWPPHVDHGTVEKAENADLRILAFGDDLTYSNAESGRAWPAHLEAQLNNDERIGETFAVINAGIPGTDSVQAVKRIERDVIPFAPHLILCSFAFGDSRLIFDRESDSWQLRRSEEEIQQAIRKLYRNLSDLEAILLHWTPNPIRPLHGSNTPRNAHQKWAEKRQRCKDWAIGLHQRACRAYGVRSIDLRAKFEINGDHTMKKWMADWCNHNETGARHIATWLSDHILHESGLRPE